MSLAGVFALGCITGPRGFKPVRFEPVESLPSTERSPHWPVPPEQAMELVRSRSYDVRVVKRTKAGTGGAMKVRIHFGSLNRDLDFKIKKYPSGSAYRDLQTRCKTFYRLASPITRLSHCLIHRLKKKYLKPSLRNGLQDQITKLPRRFLFISTHGVWMRSTPLDN